MERLFIPETIEYTGAQLRSHWAERNFGIQGDSIVAFIGPCRVAREYMVDLEDLQAEAQIVSKNMLHFIVEHFERDLEKAICRQRLLVSLVQQEINSRSQAHRVIRRGDDLFLGDRKLSVSIATHSPVSTLIHLGLNIDPEGAPVPAVGLAELGVGPRPLAEAVLAAYVQEVEEIRLAQFKVRETE